MILNIDSKRFEALLDEFELKGYQVSQHDLDILRQKLAVAENALTTISLSPPIETDLLTKGFKMIANEALAKIRGEE